MHLIVEKGLSLGSSEADIKRTLDRHGVEVASKWQGPGRAEFR